jgi:hypothetical protein
MRKLVIILTLGLTTILSFGQTNDLPQRDAFTLNLAVSDTNYYKAEIKASAFVLPDNTIQLYPGEKIYVEVELVKKEIISMKSVKENHNPDKTIIISFTQEVEGKKHNFMMLSIDNPFSKKLNYKANIYLMKHNKWVSTSVIPIGAKLGSYESWPDIITTIALSDMEFK